MLAVIIDPYDSRSFTTLSTATVELFHKKHKHFHRSETLSISKSNWVFFSSFVFFHFDPDFSVDFLQNVDRNIATL